METCRHHSVGSKECLLYSISMMAVDVDVENSLVVFQEFYYGKDAVVDIAEPRGLLLLGMMQATRPIYPNFSAPLGDKRRTSDATTRVNLAVVVHPIENRAILSKVDYMMPC
jgi:hypothetical protein